MSRFRLTLLALASATLIACDDSPPPACTEFRAGEPEVLYLSQDDAAINIPKFADMVLACEKVEKVNLAVTWTAHPPEVSGGGRVLGFGFSAFANEPLISCYEDLMVKFGASPIP